MQGYWTPLHEGWFKSHLELLHSEERKPQSANQWRHYLRHHRKAANVAMRNRALHLISASVDNIASNENNIIAMQYIGLSIITVQQSCERQTKNETWKS